MMELHELLVSVFKQRRDKFHCDLQNTVQLMNSGVVVPMRDEDDDKAEPFQHTHGGNDSAEDAIKASNTIGGRKRLVQLRIRRPVVITTIGHLCMYKFLCETTIPTMQVRSWLYVPIIRKMTVRFRNERLLEL